MLLHAQNVIIRCLSLILLRFEKPSCLPISHEFGLFAENCQKRVIFGCLKKYYLDAKRLHHRYSEVSLEPREQISEHI